LDALARITFAMSVTTAKNQQSSTTVLDNRERRADPLEAIQSGLDGRQAQIHTGMPGQIVKYDAAKMTATVQLAIQAVQTQKDGTRKNISIAPIQDVPVMFPGGGSHTFTFPIAAGDECWVAFSERNIDAWFQHGGPKPPPDWRMHDINDAVCFVGLRNQSRVLGADGKAPVASKDTTTLRSDDGKTVVQIDGPNNAITLYAAGQTESVVFVDGKNQAITTMAGGTKTVVDGSANTITVTAATVTMSGDLHVMGEVWGKFQSGPVSVTQHIHKALNQPPNVGTFAIPAEPPVITGSYGGIAALKNLLQFLDQRGDIVDQST
jgi:hypothetical protein